MKAKCLCIWSVVLIGGLLLAFCQPVLAAQKSVQLSVPGCG